MQSKIGGEYITSELMGDDIKTDHKSVIGSELYKLT
jgi:hypothetical protein